jgi:peptidoglycan/LPS O-acetylase OafA/YrhL
MCLPRLLQPRIFGCQKRLLLRSLPSATFETCMQLISVSRQPRSDAHYMRQLDGLRALAVIAVWMAHWGIMELRGFDYINWGTMGVMLFFVLSGFLITGILLRAGESVEAGDCGLWTAAKIFYIRRFLRIVPIYYLTLFAMAMLLPEVRAQFFWYATYTYNIRVALHPILPPVGGHFWSLAAEEQFYLVWPWIVLIVPRRLNLGVVFGLITCGALIRIVLEMNNHRGTALGCIDQFGFGALLAISAAYQMTRLRSWLLRLGKFVALPAFIAGAIFVHKHQAPVLTVIILPLMATMCFTWLIGGAADGFSGVGGRLLESGPLVYLGRISYGLYIFHGFVMALWAKAGLAPIANPWLQTLTFGLITVLVASISWYTIEAPINSLKRYFQMPAARGLENKGAPAAAQASAESAFVELPRTASAQLASPTT